MIQSHAFDPESGAPLTDEKFYPADYEYGVRTPDTDNMRARPDTESREGALTNGELCSTATALITHFRRSHIRQKGHDGADTSVDRSAALAFKRLKSANPSVVDTFIWYAAAERLARKGYWVAWMIDFAIPRCPRCRSEAKFRGGVDRLEAVCASAPTDHGAIDHAIREKIAGVYTAAFDNAADPDDLTLF